MLTEEVKSKPKGIRQLLDEFLLDKPVRHDGGGWLELKQKDMDALEETIPLDHHAKLQIDRSYRMFRLRVSEEHQERFTIVEDRQAPFGTVIFDVGRDEPFWDELVCYRTP